MVAFEQGTTTDRNDPALQATKDSGQHEKYLVLSADERAKGFVRPVRHSYRHVGMPAPKHPLRDLTPDEHSRYDQYHYVKYEEYPKTEDSAVVGRFWTQKELDSIGKGCGQVTRMSQSIAETYARDPKFYGATFCVGCKKHIPVGEQGEFVWEGDESRVGT
jgi:hypothetical protein